MSIYFPVGKPNIIRWYSPDGKHSAVLHVTSTTNPRANDTLTFYFRDYNGNPATALDGLVLSLDGVTSVIGTEVRAYVDRNILATVFSPKMTLKVGNDIWIMDK